MPMIARQNRDLNAGFTLAEVLIAVVISAMLALVAIRVISTASNNLEISANNAIAAQQAVRLAKLMTYDIAGASTLTAYPLAEPVGGAKCWSKSDGSTIGNYVLPRDPGIGIIGSSVTEDWLWSPGPKTTVATARASILRAIAILAIKTPTPEAVVADNLWWPTKVTYVGYEIRRAYGGNSEPYELWRTQCDEFKKLSSPPEKVASLGIAPSSLSDGTAILRCPGKIPVTTSLAPSVIGLNYTFTVVSVGNLAVGDIVKLYSPSNYSTSASGSIVAIMNNTITLSLVAAAPLGSWIFTKPCIAGVNLLSGNQFVLLSLPYSGGRDSLDSQAPLILRNRVMG